MDLPAPFLVFENEYGSPAESNHQQRRDDEGEDGVFIHDATS